MFLSARRMIWIAIALLVVPPAVCHADERYFVMIFGSELKSKRPKYTHTWATWVKATGEGPNLCEYQLECNTISWMPATLDIRPWTHKSEPGVNLGLHPTMKLMRSFREDISLWGPYEVYQSSWDRFVAQREYLESGNVRYLCVTFLSNDLNDKGCIHAITDADPRHGREKYRLYRFGVNASHHIARQFWERNRIINPELDHSWLLGRLNLTQYPIYRREYIHRDGPFDDFGWRLRGTMTE